jgi:alpha-tubulin suppressor-like RCC1 family protein/tRNA A-37 threonylcarbamoyl transferase component Bud32
MTDEWDDREVADLEDEYELLGELGRGASAVVYRARDRALGRFVAIKVVRAHSIASADDAMLRLAREARTVAKLQHPNIVTVHAVRRLGTGGLALIMQLVPGRTLKQAIVEHGPFAPEQAQQVMRDVAEALAFAHAHGVVHRDVKPENIFLDAGSGRALLSDFGIAYSAENESRLTMTGAAIGTPAYMAPEQIDGAPADARSDLYSLGLVTWEMLTGRRPWEGESLYNVISKQKNEELPAIDALRPGVVPPQLQYIVERMLQKRAAARWAGADGLIANLDHWVVPSDWRQWEAAHRRRREAARSARAEKSARGEATAPTDQATVRFRRPTTPSGMPVVDGPTGGAQVAIGAGTQAAQLQVIERATVAPGMVEDDEDETPSWAREADDRAPRSRWAMMAAALAVVTIGGGALWYGQSMGGLSRGAVNAPSAVVGAAGVAATQDPAADQGTLRSDTLVGMLDDSSSRVGDSTMMGVALRDSATRDSALLNGAPVVGAAGTIPAGAEPTPGDRLASMEMPVMRTESPARPQPNQGQAAGAPDRGLEPESPSIAATDDAGVITAGGRHSCVLEGGRAMCWGSNDRGQLGDGDVESRDLPGLVVGELEFRQIAAGLAHTCGVTRTGEAYCWGSDDRGQLGDATTTSRSAPVRVNSNLSFRLVRTGTNHSCGLTTGGAVLCWGANNKGQLGDGSSSMRTSPVRAGDGSFVSVTAGWNHTCAIARDGAPWCWGENADGQLGDGSRTDHAEPRRVNTTERFTSVAAGGNHTCGVTDGGEVLCWGRNAYGQLGNGTTTSSATPERVDSGVRFASVSVGGVHSCARTAGGQAWCWGRNTYGQLGDGTTTDRAAPVRVIGGTTFATISATGAHTCGTTSAGTAFCWGFNVQGQLGDGSRNHLAKPTRVAIPER